MKKLTMQTPDLTEGNITKIAQLFPNVITEKEDANGVVEKAVDFELLKQMLSKELVEDDNERYRLDWPGKKASLLKANTPITKTLRPDRGSSVNFDTTENVFIEGDNFEVLKVLQESYLGKIKMIYIDPPYNTGKDFVYKDNFTKTKDEYDEEIGIEDEEGGKLFKNTDTNGRFHSDWLSMIYERLLIARDLLKEDGVIFMSIDDNEVHNLRKISDEVFGEANFINQISVKAKASSGASGGGEDKKLKKNIEYLLVYSKSDSFESFESIYNKIPLFDYIKDREKEGKNFAYKSVLLNEGQESYFKTIKAGNGDDIVIKKVSNYEIKSISKISKEEGVSEEEVYNKYFDKIFTLENAQTSIRDRVFDVTGNEDDFYNCYYKPISGRNKDAITKVGFMGSTKRLVSYLSNVAEKIDEQIIKKDKVGTLWSDLSWSSVSFEGDIKYNNGKKPVSLIQRIIRMYQEDGAIVLDFFSGSSTTAHSVLLENTFCEINQKFIMVQIPESLEENLRLANSKKIKDEIEEQINFLKSIDKPLFVTELGKERIRRAGKKILEENAGTSILRSKPLDVGFRVYKADTTNMKDIYYHPSQVVQEDLFNLVSNIKEDRTPEDLLTQVILDLGLTLDLPIEKKELRGNTVYFVADNALVACFDDKIDFGIVDDIATYEPLKVVFKDASFKEEQDRTNVDTRMKRLSPETIITVL